MSLLLFDEVPAPKSSFSTSATLRPRRAASRAMPAPVMPPPTTTRSNVSWLNRSSAAARLEFGLSTANGSDLPAFPGALVGQVVAHDGGVIEDELAQGEGVEGERLGFRGVVAALGVALGPADVDGADGVLSRIARGVGIGEELLGEVHLEARLLAHLAHAGGVQGLAF